MAFSIFGYTFQKNDPTTKKGAEVKTFVDKENDDGSFTVVSSNSFGATFNKTEIEDGSGLTEPELIDQYRALAMLPEVDWAIEEIINESVVLDRIEDPVVVNLDQVKLSDDIKKEIQKAFAHITRLLDFKHRGIRIFRRWYVDGRIYYHAMIDEKNTKAGIKELRYIDPRKMRRVREIKKTPQPGGTITIRKEDTVDYYLYSDIGVDNNQNKLSSVYPNVGLRVTVDSIAASNSGILDRKNTMVLGYLHKAIRVANQLSMLESAVVIYRLTRAPERRVFYVDVGNLPPARIEQYMNYIMNKYKTKISYDSATGGLKDSKRFLSMTEDFWMPRREGSRGTEVITLPAGQNLGQMEDVEYFLKKLYKALGVPYSRVSGEEKFGYGKAVEISREEARFARFVGKLRADFSQLFNELLGKQLVLTGVMKLEEWEMVKEFIHYDFASDNYFDQQMEVSLMSQKLETMQLMRDFVGSFFSKEYVWKHVFQMDDDEIKEEKKRIKDEKLTSPPIAGDAEFAPGGPAPSAAPPSSPSPFGGQQESLSSPGISLNETESFEKLVGKTEAEKKLAESLTTFIDGLNDDIDD